MHDSGSFNLKKAPSSNFFNRIVDDSQRSHQVEIIPKPNKFVEWVNWLRAERKMVIFVLVHFIITMIIWVHFFYERYRLNFARTPIGANRYYLKLLGIPLEFGAMFAILFQMSLIPLTMSRHTTNVLSQTFLRKIVPFNRITAVTKLLNKIYFTNNYIIRNSFIQLL